MKQIIFVFLLAFFFISCSKNNSNNNGSTGGSGGSTSAGCTGTPGTLFTAVRNILQANCALSGCHAGASPQNGINFGDNCTIVTQKDRIKARAVDASGTSNQMPPPPSAPLTATERQKITDWVNAGGKITD